MKSIVAVGLLLGLATVLVSRAHAQEPAKVPFKCSCVVFDHKENPAVFRGIIDAELFKKWFKEDYAVSGERVETPKDASSFGTLVLTDGNEIFVMPLYTWGNADDRHFACQSHAIGHAPLFSVLADTQKDFIDKMKAELGKKE